MAKNKWLMALLLLGVAGVIAYNTSFFVGRDPKNGSQAPVQTSADVPAAPESGTPSPTEPASPASLANSAWPAAASAHPSWSMEQLRMEAARTLIEDAADFQKPLRTWPARDPFCEQKPPTPATLTVLPQRVEPSPRVEPPEPTYALSAILVQGARRYAVIDGNLRKVDSSVPGGKVVAIEPDHVLIKTVKGIKKLALGPSLSVPTLSPAEPGAGS